MVRMPIDARRGLIPMGITTGLTDLLPFRTNTEAATLNISIEGEPVDACWADDDTLPGPGLEPFADEDLPKRTVDFKAGFTVDGSPYDGDVAHVMEHGTSEEWTVTNSTGGVHAYPFFVTHINGKKLSENDPLRRWQDTIGLHYRQNGVDGSVTY